VYQESAVPSILLPFAHFMILVVQFSILSSTGVRLSLKILLFYTSATFCWDVSVNACPMGLLSPASYVYRNTLFKSRLDATPLK